MEDPSMILWPGISYRTNLEVYSLDVPVCIPPPPQDKHKCSHKMFKIQGVDSSPLIWLVCPCAAEVDSGCIAAGGGGGGSIKTVRTLESCLDSLKLSVSSFMWLCDAKL